MPIPFGSCHHYIANSSSYKLKYYFLFGLFLDFIFRLHATFSFKWRKKQIIVLYVYICAHFFNGKSVWNVNFYCGMLSTFVRISRDDRKFCVCIFIWMNFSYLQCCNYKAVSNMKLMKFKEWTMNYLSFTAKTNKKVSDIFPCMFALLKWVSFNFQKKKNAESICKCVMHVIFMELNAIWLFHSFNDKKWHFLRKNSDESIFIHYDMRNKNETSSFTTQSEINDFSLSFGNLFFFYFFWITFSCMQINKIKKFIQHIKNLTENIDEHIIIIVLIGFDENIFIIYLHKNCVNDCGKNGSETNFVAK